MPRIDARACVEWVGTGHDRVPVFFDGRRRLVDPFHDYVAQLAEGKATARGQQSYASTVQAAAYALLAWLRHLDEAGSAWPAAEDALLRGFRDAALRQVLASVRGKGDGRVARRTVNAQLKWIYRYYAWAERTGLCKGVLGCEAHLRSSLLRPRGHAESGRATERERYPLLFTRVSGPAGGVQHFASARDKQRIAAVLAQGADPFIVERNLILLELVDRVGWRAGTLTHLSVHDLPPAALEQAQPEGVLMCPAVQKRGYQDGFYVPLTLAMRIVRFIAQRQQWLARHGWGETQGRHRLFVSAKAGTPLGDKTITQLLGAAFRKIGVPAGRGAATHAFRRKFSEDSTADDLAARTALGLSTAVEDVMHATAMRLGQHALGSQAAYQRAVRTRTAHDATHQLRAQVQDLEARLAEQQAQNAQLRRQVQRDPPTGRKPRAPARTR